MGKTVVMTLRLPQEVAKSIDRLAERTGNKAAHLGARFVEEGVRRRDFPHIDLRETAGGRVAYLAGTRLPVYLVVQSIRGGLTPEKFSQEHDLSVERVRIALAYAHAFPDEIQQDIDQVELNKKWVSHQDAAFSNVNPQAFGPSPASEQKSRG